MFSHKHIQISVCIIEKKKPQTEMTWLKALKVIFDAKYCTKLYAELDSSGIDCDEAWLFFCYLENVISFFLFH